MKRDFTYIDDVVEGIVRVMQGALEKKIGSDGLPVATYALHNIGRGKPENLMEFVRILQEKLVRVGLLSPDFNFEKYCELVLMQPGDVPITYADTISLEQDYGYKPVTELRDGLRKFVEWFKDYEL